MFLINKGWNKIIHTKVLIVSSKPHCAGRHWRGAEIEEMSWQVGQTSRQKGGLARAGNMEVNGAGGRVRTRERAVRRVQTNAQEYS